MPILNVMKSVSIVVLTGLLLSLVSPLSLYSPCPRSHGGPALRTLNICSQSDGMDLSGKDTQYVHECRCEPVPPGPAGLYGAHRFTPKLFVFAFPEDHPPQL